MWISLATIILVVAGFFVVRYLRRQLRDDSTQREAFTLQDLRAMRDRGDISPAEYETMRAMMLGPAAAKAPPGGSGVKKPKADGRRVKETPPADPDDLA